MSATVRVIIVHRQPLVAAGIEALLAHLPDWHIVAYATDVASALTALRYRAINVLISEQELPGLNGLTLCGIVRRHFPRVSTALIGNLTPHQQRVALAHGVGRFIAPTISRHELHQLAMQLRRHTFQEHTMLHDGEHLQQLTIHVPAGDVNAPLTLPVNLLSRREREIIRLVEYGHTNKQIADILAISPYTVKQHISSVMLKCNVHKRRALAALFRDIMWDDVHHV